MQQTPPSMLARAAKEKIEFMRSGKRSDMDNETARGNNQIAKDNAASVNDPIQYKLARQRVTDTRADLDQPRIDREAQAERDRLAVIKKAQDDEAERIRLDDYARAGEGRKLRPSVMDEQAIMKAEAALKDPNIAANPRYKAFLERQLSGARAKDMGTEAMAMATQPAPDAEQNMARKLIESSPSMLAELKSLKAAVTNAGSRNAVAAGLGGGVMGRDMADVRNRFVKFTNALVANGVAKDRNSAMDLLAQMVDEEDVNRDTAAGQQAHGYLNNMSKADPAKDNQPLY